MFNLLESWDWWNRFFGGLVQQPKPTAEQFYTPEDVYTTRPEDMPGNLSYDPRLLQRAGYDPIAHERAKAQWDAREASRLRKLQQMDKLRRSTDVFGGDVVGGGYRPLEQRPMIPEYAPLDVLNPETKTMADIERMRKNMLRYGGIV